MNISPVMNKVIEYGFKKPMNGFANTRLVGWACKNFREDKVSFVTGLGLFSIILKDGLGCYMYVKQSLHNKKIPEEKRKFVAALDLANGGLMIGMQLLTFFTVSNKTFQKKVFNRIFTVFSRASSKACSKIIKESGKEYKKAWYSLEKKSQDTFGKLTALVAAVIIGKRVVVPFIATPLAEKTKAYLYKNDKTGAKKPEVTKTDAGDKFVSSTDEKKAEAKLNKPESSNLIENFKGRKS